MEYSIEQARARFGHLIDQARIAGETSTITRHGTPAAIVAPVPDPEDEAAQELAADAYDSFLELHDDTARALEYCAKLIEAEGRREIAEADAYQDEEISASGRNRAAAKNRQAEQVRALAAEHDSTKARLEVGARHSGRTQFGTPTINAAPRTVTTDHVRYLHATRNQFQGGSVLAADAAGVLEVYSKRGVEAGDVDAQIVYTAQQLVDRIDGPGLTYDDAARIARELTQELAQ